MKKVKSYTSIWTIEKVLYSINDLQLPVPVTFTQMSWFVLALLTVIVFGNVPPLSLVHGALLKYVALPVGFAWLMSQKTFDGKKPFSFLKSVFLFAIRSKATYAGKPIKIGRQKYSSRSPIESITVVRSEVL